MSCPVKPFRRSPDKRYTPVPDLNRRNVISHQQRLYVTAVRSHGWEKTSAKEYVAAEPHAPGRHAEAPLL